MKKILILSIVRMASLLSSFALLTIQIR